MGSAAELGRRTPGAGAVCPCTCDSPEGHLCGNTQRSPDCALGAQEGVRAAVTGADVIGKSPTAGGRSGQVAEEEAQDRELLPP